MLLAVPFTYAESTSFVHNKTHGHMGTQAHTGPPSQSHTLTHTYARTQHQSFLSQAIQYKDTQSSGNNLILARDVIRFDRRAEPHSPGCSRSVTNKTEGLEDETELNLGELKNEGKKTRHRERQYGTDPKPALN